MASPVVQEAIESSTNTAGTSHVVTLPTATAGQLLLIILDKGSTSATINAHASLTELLDEASANGLYIAYRWMDGTEPASYTLTSSASTRSAQIAYRISGAENPATTPPQIGTTATGTSATPDPPASANPPSSKDYLFIAFFGQAGEEADDDTWVNTPPTNFTPSPPRQKACGTAGTNLGGKIGAAERQLTTGSAQNPGTFGVDVSAAWRAQTITVHPTSSVGLTATDLAGAAPILGGPALGQTHVLTAANLTGAAPVLGTPTVSTDTEAALTADDLDGAAPVLGTPAIAQVHVLTASSLAGTAPTLGTPTIAQVHVLTAASLTGALPVLGGATMGQIHVLTSANLLGEAPLLEAATLGAPGGAEGSVRGQTSAFMSLGRLCNKGA